MGEPKQQVDEKSSLPPLGDETLWMKVCDPVDELRPDNKVQRRNKMQHQRWAASEKHCIRLPHRAKCRLHQHQVRNDSPDESLYQPLFFIGGARYSDHL